MEARPCGMDSPATAGETTARTVRTVATALDGAQHVRTAAALAAAALLTVAPA